MTNMNYVSTIEHAYTFEELEQKFKSKKVEDVTKAYKASLKKKELTHSTHNWHEFAEQYLHDDPDTKVVVFALEPGKANRVKNKYKLVPVDKFPGPKKFVKKYVLFDIEKQHIVKVTKAKTISQAKKDLKEEFSKGYQGTLDVVVMKLTDHPIVARSVNNTTKTAKLGTYLVVKRVKK